MTDQGGRPDSFQRPAIGRWNLQLRDSAGFAPASPLSDPYFIVIGLYAGACETSS